MIHYVVDNYFVKNINDWAREKLNIEEYNNFLAVNELNSQKWKMYTDEGKIKFYSKYEKFFVPEFNTEIDIAVGRIAESVPPFNLHLLECDPEFKKYLAMYLEDYPAAISSLTK